jgi:hypothetical protein
MLPPDLSTAETDLLACLRAALAAEAAGHWTVELRFEGLRILPVALRLAEALGTAHPNRRLLFPDAGAAALACRDAPALAGQIGSFSDQIRLQGETGSDGLLLLVAPGQADYEQVERLCGQHRGALVLLNPNLEDAAVGIGSVARQRRKGFLSTWQTAYALLPDAESALRRAHPGEWELYRLDPDGYRLVRSFERRPDGESRAEALAGTGGVGLAGQLRGLNDLLEGLQR